MHSMKQTHTTLLWYQTVLENVSGIRSVMVQELYETLRHAPILEAKLLSWLHY